MCKVEKTRWPVSAKREGQLDGLEVAHLTYEEDVGVLPQGGAKRTLERGAVGPDLPSG